MAAAEQPAVSGEELGVDDDSPSASTGCPPGSVRSLDLDHCFTAVPPVLCCAVACSALLSPVGFPSVCVGFDHNYGASSPLYFHSIHLPNKFYKMDDQPFPKMYVSCFRIFVAKKLNFYN